ncbi:hypothetical protein LAZ67_2005895 [Cordylochernes scorpioides]|uniref:RNase H type-1 domain-containing protein n=1 Tax=Cordylochernes scorpioides TaxID=51811 RepID=A0ABY6K853_9ARAC|nr:hypothetical protein LAZ67_2005895 [Cordylochernes scorpioides]
MKESSPIPSTQCQQEWKSNAAHDWYRAGGISTGSVLPREQQSLISRLKSGHLRTMTLQNSLISGDEHKEFSTNLSSSPYIYGLPKTHKPLIPLRPIIAYHLSPASALSRFLTSFLTPLIKRKENSYSLTGIPSFLEELSQLNPAQELIMCSFDVVSLYLSLPLNSSLKIRGSPMGSPLSMVVAELVMSCLDCWINSQHASDIIFWRRYIDDIFCICSKDKNVRNINRLPANSSVTVQWLPAHVGIPGNELADSLAKAGALGLPEARESTTQLDERDLLRTIKTQCLQEWKSDAAHDWYRAGGTSTGSVLPREQQSLISRLKSGHLRTMTFQNGCRVFPLCTKCNSQPATPRHIIDCIDSSIDELYSSPADTIKNLKLYKLDTLVLLGFVNMVQTVPQQPKIWFKRLPEESRNGY